MDELAGDRAFGRAGGWVRNGDRWTVTHRYPDGSLTVSHIGGHGRVVLPGDYVADDVALAYALTVHKAQGVTVDQAVLLADSATTAEALYVGMTRGRHHNAALVVCDDLDPEHHDPTPPATEVLIAALRRVSAEQAALDVLRQTLAASESLAVLAPRLANLNAWLRRETPPDPALELQRLAARRTHVERHPRPGGLTRAGRLLRQLDERQRQLEHAGKQRQAWLEQHRDTFTYRDELARQIASRRQALGLQAIATQPQHLVDLLGPVPDDEAGRSRWARAASGIEAYREQWDVDSEDLHRRPVDSVQYRDWEASVETAEMRQRLDALRPDRGVDRDLGIGL